MFLLVGTNNRVEKVALGQGTTSALFTKNGKYTVIKIGLQMVCFQDHNDSQFGFR